MSNKILIVPHFYKHSHQAISLLKEMEASLLHGDKVAIDLHEYFLRCQTLNEWYMDVDPLDTVRQLVINRQLGNMPSNFDYDQREEIIDSLTEDTYDFYTEIKSQIMPFIDKFILPESPRDASELNIVYRIGGGQCDMICIRTE